MSDVSVLTHEYQTASELAQTINEALITLKKVTLHLPGSDAVQQDAVQQCAERLAQIVEALVNRLDPAADPSAGGIQIAPIPESLVSRLQRERQGDLAYYVDDLRQLTDCLRIQPRQLKDAQLLVLDQLAAATEGEAAGVFRRLMRT